ncbi:hypothetical protein Bca52824_083667 [Brassica carinata]|uniref:Uncharacterized protein n=1 Tax=Brassica carinata TaxID=52824 RepID=A0A8X7TU21_BRACI|nr:hypothetical protein Bca52824_083667 [Brassica carinata]
MSVSMLLPPSPPPSTLSAFVGLLKFVVGQLLSYRSPCCWPAKTLLLGITSKRLNNDSAYEATKLQTWIPNLYYQQQLLATRFMCPREPKKLMKQCQALKTKKRGK